MNPAARKIISTLHLEPLAGEGGFFAPTYVSADRRADGRAAGSAIYFLLAPGHHSALHRLKGEEMWHFYAGDPVEMLQLHPDGRGEVIRLGPDIARGERPQIAVARGVWQGAWVTEGGAAGFALLGCTLVPAWDEREFELGDRQSLGARYPDWAEMICALTP